MDSPSDQPVADLSTLFARLPLDRQTALEHATRRRILRQLHEGETPQTPLELAAREGQPLSSISYHARVLTGCGLVSSATTRRLRGNAQPCLISTVRDDRRIRLLLAATEAEDGGP